MAKLIGAPTSRRAKRMRTPMSGIIPWAPHDR
ncbi:hypothetical protein R2601_03363 [Salipiger bermudensis HTCC2601]|uniref:Uncharacterized protein n=1 Tax=Salipiger bermudensis (strain DSM 26914 / JCM 13377 / KCTC 12554 / HTCC2601) TaxID=314265 RepID=Q0FWH3_SALBH|nr:hypothetical protein R2601_03363 [Salipiger bermudensis HTCC2601]